MINIISVLTIIILFIGCAAAPLSRKQEEVAIKAIEENNFDLFKSQFTTKESEEKGQYSCLLQFTTEEMRKDKVCRNEIVNFLLEKGAKYSESYTQTQFHGSVSEQLLKAPGDNGIRTCQRQLNFSHLLDSGCDSLIKDAINRMEPLVTGNVLRLNYVNRNSTADIEKDMKYVPLVIERLNSGKEKNKPDDSTKLSAVLTKALESHEKSIIAEKENKEYRAAEEKRIEKETAKQEKEEEFRNSNLGQACSALENIKTADKWMTHEQEVGKESGFVNKKTMHDMGQLKVFAKKNLEEMKIKIKKETGKEFNPKNCKNIN